MVTQARVCVNTYLREYVINQNRIGGITKVGTALKLSYPPTPAVKQELAVKSKSQADLLKFGAGAVKERWAKTDPETQWCGLLHIHSGSARKTLKRRIGDLAMGSGG